MKKIKLTKKQYLGEGYFVSFKNNETGEMHEEECTKEQYESMGGKGGAKNNPTIEGHTFVKGRGGTVKVDNPGFDLQNNEYCETPDGMAVVVENQFLVVDPKEIVDDEIEVITSEEITN